MRRHTDLVSLRATGGLLLLALTGMAAAQNAANGDERAFLSPRWTYEIRAGSYEPDLEAFETFYGDDSEDYYGLAGSYRFTDWLEVGGEYSQMRAKGVGFLTSSQAPGSSVTYQLRPAHVYANFIWQRGQRQRVVPYGGLGVTVGVYDQDIAGQSSSDGTTDVGYTARLGVRFLVGVRGPTSTGSSYWRSYVFLEAQHISIEADGFELGGDAYMVGFRMEFDFDGT